MNATKVLNSAVTAAVLLTISQAASAADYTWVPTAAGTKSWNDVANWTPNSGFPNSAIDNALLNTNVLGAQTISLNQNIAVNTVWLGDLDGSHSYTLNNGSGTGNSLSFSTFNVEGAASTSVNVNLAGNGKLNKSGPGTLTLGAANSGFTGQVDISGGQVSFGTGTPTRLSAATGYTLRSLGFLNTTNTIQSGVNRLNPSATMTFEGGRYFYGGASTASPTTYTESGPSIALGSGSGAFDFQPGNNTDRQFQLTLSGISRTGGVLQIRANSLGGAPSTPTGIHRLMLANTSGLTLIGAGGAPNTNTASVIPWMIGGQGSAITSNQPRDFMTYTANGFEVVTAGTTNQNTTNSSENVVHGTSGLLSLSAARIYNSLKLSNSGTLGLGSHNLQVTSGAIIMGSTGSAITSSGGVLSFGSGNEGFIYAHGANNVAISAPIAGNAGLTKGSTGTLTLSGANSYTGNTTVAGGTLRMGVANGVDAGSEVRLANTSANSLHNGVTFFTTSLNTSGFNQAVAGLSGGGDLGGSVVANSATLTIGKNAALTSNYSGTLSGLGGAVVKNGTSTQTFSGNNLYTGTTTVNAGTLKAGSTHAFSDSASAVTVNATGTVDLAGQTQVAGKAYTLAGGTLLNSDSTKAATIGDGASVTVTNGGSYEGAGTAATVSIGAPGGVGGTAAGTALMYLSSIRIDNAGAGYTNTPTVTLSPPNLPGGTQAVVVAQLTSGAVSGFTILNPGSGYTSVPTLTLSGTATTAATLTPVGSVQGVLLGSGGSGYTSAPSVSFTGGSTPATGVGGFGSINVTADSSIGGAGGLDVRATIGGAGGLTKIGSGVTKLFGSNTYAGNTVVGAGTLLVNNINGSATGTGNVVVQTAGTIGGSGAVAGGLTVDGTVSPGNSPGTLTVGGTLTLGADGNYNWQVVNAAETGAVAGEDYDTIVVSSGTLDLSDLATPSDTFNVNLWSLSDANTSGNALNWNEAVSHTWTLISTNQQIDGFDSDLFAINVLPANGTAGFTNAFSTGTFSTALSADGTDLLLTYSAVPEPATMTLAGLIGFTVLGRRRRR